MKGESLVSNQDELRITIGNFAGYTSGRRLYYKKIESSLSVPRSEELNIIWIHDFYHYHKQLIPIASDLILANPLLKIYLVDLYGHGLSGGTSNSCSDLACYDRDIIKLLDDEIRGSAIIIGQGLGALVSLSTSLLYGRKDILGVIAANPLLEFSSKLFSPWKKILSGFSNNLLGKVKLKSEITFDNLSLSKNMTMALENDSLACLSFSLSEINALVKSAYKIKDAGYYFDLPLLLLSGKKNAVVSSEWISLFAKMLPRELLTYVEYEDHGHDLFLQDSKSEVVKTICRWLGRFTEREPIC